MLNPNSPSCRALSRRRIAACLAAATALVAFGCQSALGPDYGTRDSNPYYQSLIAREVLRTNNPAAYSKGTVIGGIEEYARVDEPGAATAPTTIIPPAGTLPASQIGLPWANLNVPEPVFDLSLQDAIARAAKHSLSIKVDAYNPAIKQVQIIAAEAIFDPTIFGQSQWTSNDDPQNTPNSFQNGQGWSNQIGVRKLLTTGGSVTASFNSTLRDINLTGITVPPPPLTSSWASNINLQVTQPLLRGFGSNVTEANIYLAQRDLGVSLSEFKQNTMKTVADVEDAYQNVVLARVNVEILQRLVTFSEHTYNDIKARLGIDATVASVSQALSALQNRRAELFIAQKDLRNASDRLKTAINDPEIDINSNVLINPIDRPTIDPVRYDLVEAITTALSQRPEMHQARLQIERADIVVTVAKNELLPRLDLVGSIQGNGYDHGFDQSVVRTIDPMNRIDFVFGVRFEIPLGNRAAEAGLAQHKLEREQAIENMVQIAQHVVQDVKAQLRELLSRYQEIQYREAVRVAASDELQGYLNLLEIRARTPEFMQLILDSQARLANAEQQLISAIVAYNLAIMRLEQAKGTLLEFNRISLDHPPTPKESDVLSKLRITGKSTVFTK